MLRSLIQIKPRDVPLRVALRNTTAIVLPLAIGIASGQVAAGLGVATGALNTMFSDQPGPYRLRMRRMLLTALAAGVSAFAGSVLGAHPALLVIAALLWGVGGGLLVALGTDAGRVGLTSMILLVVMAAQPREVDGAAAAAALIFAGGVLQTLFAIAAWPLQRYRPERQALADICRQLAGSARASLDPALAPPVTQALIDVEHLLHGAHRARGPVMERFRILAELVERIRLELLALGDLRDTLAEGEARSTLGRLLEYAARTLDALAVALERGSSPLTASAAMEGLAAALTALIEMQPHQADRRMRRQLLIAIARAQGLAGQLRAAVRNTAFAGSRGDLRAQAVERKLPRALRPRDALAVLRANIGLSSIAFRHALRCGVCLALAVAAERVAGLAHGYWIPMTIAIVLKPDFAGTFRVGLLRVAGTLAGLVLTSVVLHYAFDGAWEQLALLALLCVGFRMLVTMHYGLGVMLLTGMVVILLAFNGTAPGDTMLARGIASVIGSAAALAAYALWPTWEHDRVRPALAAMLAAYRDYFHDLLHADPGQRASTRTTARSARTNAEASIARMRSEPHGDRQLLALADGVFANANRFIRASMSLEAALDGASALRGHAALLAFAVRVEASLDQLTATLRDGSSPAIRRLREEERALVKPLVAADDIDNANEAAFVEAIDRITDSIDTLAHLIRQAEPATHRQS